MTIASLKTILKSTAALTAAAALAACGGSGGGAPAPAPPPAPAPTPTPPPPTPPTPNSLSVNELTGAATPDLHNMTAFTASANATPSVASFEGALAFPETSVVSAITPNLEPLIHPGFSILRTPAFTVNFVSDNGDLIPVERQILSPWPAGGSYWDAVIGTGRIWAEPDDMTWSRASFPITLVSRREGQARNCVASFLFNQTSVSRAFLQCSQENAAPSAYAPGDMRAQINVTYTPGAIARRQAVIDDQRAREAARFPAQHWNDLPVADPIALQATFNEGATGLGALSDAAIIVDGVLYRQTPMTRRGAYPYPEELRHGVHSITKSLGAGVAMLYLAERYGDAVFDELITDHVPGLALHPGWQGVTFEHTLNMATGVSGEDAGATSFLFRGDSAAAAIAFIEQNPDAAPAPGAAFSYATTHTFVLSVAMQNFVKSREGASADYWDMVQENVLDVIGVRDFPMQRTLEPGNARGTPTLGVGAFPSADDIAKIATLYANDGAAGGMQLLNMTRTRDALNKTSWPGSIVSQFTRYKNSFWIYTISSSALGCTYQVPTMQGFGANFVGFSPSGLIGFRLADNENYDSAGSLLRAADQIRPSC